MRLATLILLLAAQASARGVHGEFTPASPRWMRGAPASSSEVRLDCALDLTARTMEWDSPYALYCLEVADREPIVVWTDEDGTEYDPVLYLYCDTFDPGDPTRGAIIFDDDGGPDAMAMFHAADGLSLEPGRPYWLMIAWYDSLDEGRYLIKMSDNVGLCAVAVERVNWSRLKSLYHRGGGRARPL